jgi:uncharacterized membrane protein required for colicin V production
MNTVIAIASIILAIYLTRLILSSGPLMAKLYQAVPGSQSAIENHEIWVRIPLIVILTLIINCIFQLLTMPVYRLVFGPVSELLSSVVDSINGFAKRLIGALWKLPKSVWLVLVFTLLLYLVTGFPGASLITEYADESAPYRLVRDSVIQPLLDNATVKNIEVILNDSFRAAQDTLDNAASRYLTEYFNGMPLDDAVKSNPEIDAKAREIVGAETGDKQKARLIYSWICKNVTYDNGKAAALSGDSSAVSSGAIVAFDTGAGVCFDFACLYVAMCRAVDLKVRFLTGLGYTGAVWGDHAWNQVYDSKSGAWIDVDTTFGSSSVDYFDRPNFDLDHRDGVVQDEWSPPADTDVPAAHAVPQIA